MIPGLEMGQGMMPGEQQPQMGMPQPQTNTSLPMGREQLLAIVSTFQEPELLKMLSVAGVQMGGGMAQGMHGEDGDRLETWNDRSVTTGPDNRPILHDPTKWKQPVEQPNPDYMAADYQGSMDPYKMDQEVDLSGQGAMQQGMGMV